MKKLLFFFSICLFIGVPVFAQQDSAMVKNMTDKMQTELSLSQDQYSRVYGVNQQFVAEMKTLQASGGGRFAKLKKMKSIGSERDQQMKEILSPDQYQVYLKNKAANRQKLKADMKSKSGGVQ